jgi:hypothetical protein
MMQECPKCENKFKLLNVRSSFGGIETLGRATFCPYCGVNLDSWDAWFSKEVLLFYDDKQLDGIPVILEGSNDDYSIFDVRDQETNEVYEVSQEFVYTPE